MSATARRRPLLWLCQRLLDVSGALLPLALRRPWREAWEGELLHRWCSLERRGALDRRRQLDLLRRSAGAFSHAVWLTVRHWRSEPMVQDLRYAVRNLRQRPGFTAAALLSLALGIGANTLIFTLVNAVVLHPFPYPQIDRLVALGVAYPQLGGEERIIEAISDPELTDVEAASHTLNRFVAFDLGNRDLGGVEEPERLFTAFVWHDPFPTLGLAPAVGRGFTAEEIAGREPVAIVSYRVWQERFGGDPGAVGSTIVVNGEARTLVGVMPERLSLLDTDLWLPMWALRGELPRGQRQMTILARIRDGYTLQQVESELDTVARRTERQLGEANPEYAGWRLAARPWMEVWRGFVGPAGEALLGAVALVLLIACANLGGLLLARGVARQREMAVRSALGAERLRLVRQLAVESLLLAVVGGGLGLLLATVGLDGAARLLPERLVPASTRFAVDGTVLAYTALVSLGCALVFGLVPAWVGSRAELRGVLVGSRAAVSRGGAWFRRLLVVGELGLAVTLVAGSLLLARSYGRLQHVDPGVDTDRVLTFRLTLPGQRYQGEQVTGFFARLLEGAAAVPGVRSAALASQFPPGVFLDRQFHVEGALPAPDAPLPTAYMTEASPGLLRTLGVALRRGRDLAPTDRAGGDIAVLVNEALARRYFPGGDPVGQRLRIGSGDEGPLVTIVGVYADARNRGLDQPVRPELLYSFRQNGGGNNQLFLLLRTVPEPLSLLPRLRDLVRGLDPDLPLYAIETLEQRFADTVAARRIAARLFGLFAGVAVLLAAVGIYGLVAFTVRGRTREIGLRIALGADRRDILRWVLGRATQLVVAGILSGVAAALALSRSLEALLFEVDRTDPLSLAGASALLVAASLLASLLPARRALRLAPHEALREP